MKIGGWKTRSVFERYAIVSRTDIVDAMRKLQQAEKLELNEPIPIPVVDESPLPGALRAN